VHPLLAPAHVLALIRHCTHRAARGPGRARAAIIAAFAAGLAFKLVAIALGARETRANEMLWAVAGGCASAAAAGMCLGSGFAATVAPTIAFTAGATLGLDSPPETISLGEVAVLLIGAVGRAGSAATYEPTTAPRRDRARTRVTVLYGKVGRRIGGDNVVVRRGLATLQAFSLFAR
jgi:hypothetical protein